MTIRKKLFYAFVGVMALPLTLAFALSLYYVKHEREALVQRTRTDVITALVNFNAQREARKDALRQRVENAAHELAVTWNTNTAIVIRVQGNGKIATVHQRTPGEMEPLEKTVQKALVLSGVDDPASDGPRDAAHDDADLTTLCSYYKQMLEIGETGARNVQIFDPQTDAPLCPRAEANFWVNTAANFENKGLHYGWSADRGSIWYLTRPSEEAPWLGAEFPIRGIVAPKRVAGGWLFEVDAQTRELNADPHWRVTVGATRLIQSALATFDTPGEHEVATNDGERYIVLRDGGDASIPSLVTLAAVDMKDVLAPLRTTYGVIASVMLLSLALALQFAYYLSGRFVGTLGALERGAEAIARGDFQEVEQKSTESSDEFGRLANSMNKMARRLAEKMRRDEVEGWRRLVRVLSHEINNTLGPVRSVAMTVRDQIVERLRQARSEDAAEDLELAFRVIVDRTDALTAFIANYAELAKLPDPERAPAQVGAVAQSTVELLRDLATGHKVRLLDHLDPELPDVPIDRAQIERVAINLVKNAIEASPEGGEVVVRTTRGLTGVELVVEDDGPGISVDARRHLFVPYFTTKPGGTGLGLALARQIVLSHGGSIVAEDREGGGTRMRVTLPLG